MMFGNMEYMRKVQLISINSNLIVPKPQVTMQSHLLTPKWKKSFENIVDKQENAGSQHFLLFRQCFLPCERQILFFSKI